MGMFVLYLGLHDSMDIITKLGYLASGASSDLGHLGRHASGAGSDPRLPQIPGFFRTRASYFWGFLFLGLLISGASYFWGFLFLRLLISGASYN